AVVRKLENMSEKTLPYKISKHNLRHTRGGHGARVTITLYVLGSPHTSDLCRLAGACGFACKLPRAALSSGCMVDLRKKRSGRLTAHVLEDSLCSSTTMTSGSRSAWVSWAHCAPATPVVWPAALVPSVAFPLAHIHAEGQPEGKQSIIFTGPAILRGLPLSHSEKGKATHTLFPPVRVTALPDRYFLVDFSASPTIIPNMLDHLERDIDVIRPTILKKLPQKTQEECPGLVPPDHKG
ncbi:RT06 protein, partial [Polyodon spathula]|nr:RT06 protein [Polyodon spathula]